MTRRSLFEIAGGLTLASYASAAAEPSSGRLKQSACRWCYKDMSLDDLCRHGAKIGLTGIDLVSHDEWPTVRKYGLVPSMTPGAGTIPDGIPEAVEFKEPDVAPVVDPFPGVAAHMG